MKAEDQTVLKITCIQNNHPTTMSRLAMSCRKNIEKAYRLYITEQRLSSISCSLCFKLLHSEKSLIFNVSILESN